MFAYPFQNSYLKSNLTRSQLAEKLTEVTFLSDANYKKRPKTPPSFMGKFPKSISASSISLKNKTA